eukprot:scaffold85125_cov24-Phaeocystis_antarctica.AAC.1
MHACGVDAQSPCCAVWRVRACLQPPKQQVGQRGELGSVVLFERDVVSGHEAVQHLPLPRHGGPRQLHQLLQLVGSGRARE